MLARYPSRLGVPRYKRLFTPAQKLLRRVILPSEPNGCWGWSGLLSREGYAKLKVGGMGTVGHRMIWELFNGHITAGLELDHLCRARACVNPTHLELVSHKENVLRGCGPSALAARRTHCVKGHELSGANLYPTKASSKKRRVCRPCLLDAQRRYRGRQKAAGGHSPRSTQ